MRDGRRAIRMRQQTAQMNRVAGNFRVATDRRFARTVEHGEERALAGQRRECIGVIDARQNLARPQIAFARLDGDGALPGRRQKFRDLHNMRRVRLKPEALHAGERENGGVHLAGVQLGEPCCDIASQRHDAQVGPDALGDGLTARRRGAERGALRQVGEGRRLAADEDVARIFALQAGRQHQAGLGNRRHVLGRMHGEVDAAVEQRLFYFLRE
jgi:hypothetical protein